MIASGLSCLEAAILQGHLIDEWDMRDIMTPIYSRKKVIKFVKQKLGNSSKRHLRTIPYTLQTRLVVDYRVSCWIESENNHFFIYLQVESNSSMANWKTDSLPFTNNWNWIRDLIAYKV